MGSIFDLVFDKGDKKRRKEERRQVHQWRIEAKRQFQQWIKECVPSNKLVLCADMYEGYYMWCNSHGFQPVDNRRFGIWLQQYCPYEVRRLRRRLDGILKWHYKGIRLKNECIKRN